jgi:hypothetical protein
MHVAGAGGRSRPTLLVYGLVLLLLASYTFAQTAAAHAETVAASLIESPDGYEDDDNPVVGAFDFPAWYQDQAGVRLVPCLEVGLECHLDGPEGGDGEGGDPEAFPDAFFYFAADAVFSDPQGADVRLVEFALAGGFDNLEHLPVAGDEAVFNELRIRIRGLQPSGTYTITHPYGVVTAAAGANGRLEVGAEGAGATGPVTSFLVPTTGPTQDGFLSDGETPARVTGSPLGTNFVRIQGPDGFDIRTEQFVLFGQLFEPGEDATAPVAAPTPVSAAAGPVSAQVTWSRLAHTSDGGAPIKAYRLTVVPTPEEGATETPVATVVDVPANHGGWRIPGLTAGQEYTIEVAAVNAVGAGTSAASGPVTPTAEPVVPGPGTPGPGTPGPGTPGPGTPGPGTPGPGTPGPGAPGPGVPGPGVPGPGVPGPGDVTRVFSDVAGSAHLEAIRWIFEHGITGGFSDGTFRPGQAVTRGQMASFLDRALGLPEAAPGGFSDTAGTTHEAAIDRLVAAGITVGFSDGTFRPGQAVTRGQMASFLHRALA